VVNRQQNKVIAGKKRVFAGRFLRFVLSLIFAPFQIDRSVQILTNLQFSKAGRYECDIDTNYDGRKYYDSSDPPSHLNRTIVAQKTLILQGLFAEIKANNEPDKTTSLIGENLHVLPLHFCLNHVYYRFKAGEEVAIYIPARRLLHKNRSLLCRRVIAHADRSER
jgi:hypothetical protein